jgi:hypothetical protein
MPQTLCAKFKPHVNVRHTRLKGSAWHHKQKCDLVTFPPPPLLGVDSSYGCTGACKQGPGWGRGMRKHKAPYVQRVAQTVQKEMAAQQPR